MVVVMRKIDGVRGTVEGELRGFDRHLNMILGDAQEVFVLPSAIMGKRDEQGGGGEEKGKEEKKGGKRLMQRKRGRRAGKKHKLPQKQQIPVQSQQQQQQQQQQQLQQHQATKAGNRKREAALEIPKQQGTQHQQRQIIHRSLPQVLIRGDNVVMVFEAKSQHATCTFLPPLPSSEHDEETEKKEVVKKEGEQEDGEDLARPTVPSPPAQEAIPQSLSRAGGEKMKREEDGQGEGVKRKRPRLGRLVEVDR